MINKLLLEQARPTLDSPELDIGVEETHIEEIDSVAELIYEHVELKRQWDEDIEGEIRKMEVRFMSWHLSKVLDSFEAPKQVGRTCCANACAAAIYLANNRIVGRRRLGFKELREKIIAKYGYDGGDEKEVLKKFTLNNMGGRLHFEEIDEAKARHVLSKKKHPLVASFYLTNEQWDRFSLFFKKYPGSTLTRGVISGETDAKISIRKSKRRKEGHVVLATGVDASGNLILLNSWGREWGNNGYFKIQNAAVLNLKFHWVYFLESDISERERLLYRKQQNLAYAVLNWKVPLSYIRRAVDKDIQSFLEFEDLFLS